MPRKKDLFSRSYQLEASSSRRGVSLIDTLVGIAIMTIIFIGISAAFRLSVDVITNNKARAGAIALSDQRMEYIRSLSYASVGTSGGIPSGSIPQSESVSLNGVNYTRRTFIEYEDDPADGTGSHDANGIDEDYKSVKVDVAWTTRNVTRHVTLVTRVSPAAGLETNVSGGTLVINAVNSGGTALPGATITIVNASTSPAINITTFTDASGTVQLLGAPAAAGYQITVTGSGYSTAQTYSVTSQNTNPSPGNLTVSNNRTTSATFAIDVLGTKTINTWTQIVSGTWTDNFSNSSQVGSSTNITIGSGTAALTSAPGTGTLNSVAIGPSYLNSWGNLSWAVSEPSGTSFLVRVYDSTGSNLIPDAQLPGNAAGFASSPVNLSGISTSTYPTIVVGAAYSSPSASTPALDTWSVGYQSGPQPLPSIAFTLQGAKTIGTGPSGTVYKYSQSLNTGASASLTIPNLEWDNYTVSINGTSTSYDVASACGPQPESLSPGASMTSNFYLAAHTTNSLLVDVRSAGSGALLTGATVHLSRTGYSATSTTDSCGQSFFSGLTSASNYSISVSDTGYTTYTSSAASVSGTSRLSVSL